MLIVQKFRHMLPPLVTEEFDNIIAGIVSFFGVEHKPDGTHGDITADSITIGGVPVIPGSGGGGGGTETFLTANAEPSLPNSRKLAAGANVSLDTATPGWMIINAAGGGSGTGMNLDYLGDFAPGPVYNDGDIVIATDGIAYMCVKDGTTTPPEPWPGGGVAVNATVDAKYWVVSGHAALTNERVMSALANGYVKSIVGEPSTVAIIPITDGGTGANNATTARTNLGVGNVGTLNLNGNANTYLNGAGAWSTPGGVPSGSIIFFTTPCPAGYTRVAAWDGRYVRMNSSHGTGGAGSHTHGPGTYAAPAHTHTPGTYEAASHSHSGSGLSVASHTHGVSGSTSSAGVHSHNVSATTGGESNGSMVMDAGGDMNCVRAPHVHTFQTESSSAGSHAHDFSATTGSASPGVSGSTGTASPDVIGVSGPASALGLTGTSDARANDPLYVDFFACQKD